MKTARVAALAALLPIFGCSEPPPAGPLIIGEVVDGQGKPVAGARVGIQWTVYQSSPVSGAETSAGGHFRVPIPDGRLFPSFFPQPLMVVDARSQTGVLIQVPESEVAKPQKCVLEPLVKVTIKWKLDERLPKLPGRGDITISAADFGGTLMSSSPWKREDVVLMLPPGKYTLLMSSSWEKGFTQLAKGFVVESGSREMLVGPLDLDFIGRSGLR